MSGVAGGDKIKKSDVKITFEKYQKDFLSKIPGFQSAQLTGSVKSGVKRDYGDLDLIVYFDGDDKREVKQRIITAAKLASDDIIVPFKSKKYAGRKYYNAGELISVMYPIQGADGYIQIDNIISLSPEESKYKESFLNMPANKQGLLLGLAKVILLEEKPEDVFKRLGISNIPQIQEDQEYEFNLSPTNLSLRIADVINNKTVGHKTVWSTNSWNAVKKLFKNYDINSSFEELLKSMSKKFKNPRSRRRIPGLFKSMITIKSGEVGTPKAQMKQDAYDLIDKTFAVSFQEHYFFESDEYKNEIVGLYAGGFKPPHKGHFSIVERLSKEVDRIIIFIGHKIREGESITAKQAKKIWEIYVKHIDIPIEIVLSKVTPVSELYDWVGDNQDKVKSIVVGGTSDSNRRFQYFKKNKYRYKKVNVKNYDLLKNGNEEKLSATTIRKNPQYLKSMKWAPDVLSKSEKKDILQIIGA